MESGGDGDLPALSRGSGPITGKFPFMVKHRKQKDHPENASERLGGDVTPAWTELWPRGGSGGFAVFLRSEQEMVNSVCK